MSDDGGGEDYDVDVEGGEGEGGGTFTETTHENLGERLQGACAGICIGLLLFFGSFPLLFWNEHRAVDRYDALRGAESQTVAVNPLYIDPANDGKVVHFSANITNGGDALVDTVFGFESDGLTLRREAEMYQWVETSSTSSKKDVGGGKTKTTTYTYDKEWKSYLVSTSNFKQSGYTNPTTMEYTNAKKTADPILVGSYELPSELESRITWEKSLPVDVEDITDGSIRNRTTKTSDGYLYYGNSYQSPQVGDQRVKWYYVPESIITIIGVQNGNTLSAFVSESGEGGDVLLMQQGTHSAAAMYDQAEAENAALSWILRFVGWFLMGAGLYLVFRPIEVFADIIPCVGSIIGCGLIFMSVVLSALLSALTISIAWLTAHPKIGAIILVVTLAVIGCCAFGVKYLERRRADAEEDGKDCE